MKKVIDYRNKNILAPMVRIGTLPTRLLALDYGADLVYSEEIIDHKVLQCSRKENALLDTIDFVLSDGTVVFRTCDKEKASVVFQMGTSDAQRALKVAKMVENDVAAIDINMGCPKEFSIKGGMGAALLTQPDKIKDILTTLVENLSIPVTCKIRILPTPEENSSLIQLIQSTGVQALGVHGRYKQERPRHDNHNDVIKTISQELDIPVIANGGSKEIECFADIEKFKNESGCSSVMLARVAQWNPSIFCSSGMSQVDDVIKQYLKYAIQYDNELSNTKYCIQQILHKELSTERGRAFQGAGLMTQVCDLFGMGEECEAGIAARNQKQAELARLRGENGTDGFTKRLTEDGTEIIEMPIIFNKKEYDLQVTPKSILYGYCQTRKIPNPVYETTENKDRTFACVVVVENQRFSSYHSGISKKYSEQSAAVVCLRYLGIDDQKKTFELTKQTGSCNDCVNSSVNKRTSESEAETNLKNESNKRTKHEIDKNEQVVVQQVLTNKNSLQDCDDLQKTIDSDSRLNSVSQILKTKQSVNDISS